MNKFYYWGPLLYQTKINEEDLNNLSLLCEKKMSYNTKLAGHLDNQYTIDTNRYMSIINKYLLGFYETFKHFYNRNHIPLYCNAAWVNFMQNGDFNPPHIHTECNISSVLYLDIPNELVHEAINYKGTLGFHGAPGSISFMYGEDKGPYFVTCKNFFPTKGDFFIFPSLLSHMVYPFKSKVERISIAANFKEIQINKNEK